MTKKITLIEEHWKIGRENNIISDQLTEHNENTHGQHREEYEYYGGHLVCENIRSNRNLHIIKASYEMLEVLLSLENDNNTIPDKIWEMRNKAIERALGKAE